MKKFLAVGIIVFSVVCFVNTAHAIIVPVYDDLWDISNGNAITGSSPIYDRNWEYPARWSDARDMFGGNYAVNIATGSTLFEDWHYYTGAQWISWETPAPVSIGSINLFTPGYDQARTYSQFRLYANDFNNPVYTFTPDASFDGILSATIAPITASSFKAEFDWRLNGGEWNSSVLVQELDGFAPKQVVPEPATMSLLGLGILGLAGLKKRK